MVAAQGANNENSALGKTALHTAKLATGFLALGLGLAAHAADTRGWDCPSASTGAWLCQSPTEATAPVASGAVPTTPASRPTPTARPASNAASSLPHKAPAAVTQTTPCGTPTVVSRRPATPNEPVPADAPVRMQADHVSGTTQHVELTGNVRIDRGNRSLQAQRIIYDKRTDRADAAGDVRFEQPGLQISGRSGYTLIHGERGEFNDAHYRLTPYNARGSAKKIEKINGTITHLDQATFTTCPAPKPAWQLSAHKVELNSASGIGQAYDVKVEFKGVPLLYSPWLSFPIGDRRKSGFLAPSIGHSGQSGAEISIPYYWNIAPNQDATITPRLLSKRGLQLNGEYRYLTASSHGTIGASYLPDDRRYGGSRSLFSFNDQSRFSAHWRADVSLSRASDRTYFQDLGRSLNLATTTSLERRIDLRYDNGPWAVLGRLQNFQPLTNTPDTYERLPQILVHANVPDPHRPLIYHVYGEAVRFQHAGSAVTGTRLDLDPGVTLDLRGAAWFLRPQLNVRYTHYSLSDVSPGQPRTLTRTTPIVSVDSGLYFDRNTHWGQRALVQTLEPRLFYLYVPYRDQSNIPIFDTTPLDFGFNQLFRTNRFAGADRQGDANQLSAALTTRFLDPDGGQELLRASLGEIFYFRNRKVVLPGDSVDRTSRSALAGEVAAAISRHGSVSVSGQWDPNQRQTDQALVRYHYQRDQRHIINLEYRYLRGNIQQADLAALWPLTSRWQAVARWDYSIRDRRTLEALAGVEYDSCCWAVRLAARRYITASSTGVGSTQNTGIYLQLILKGLGSVGQRVDDLLEHGILGYGNQLYVQ